MTAHRRQYRLHNECRTRARKMGLAFDLRFDDCAIPEVCPVLGIKLNPSGSARSNDLPSIDRFDPSKGYTRDNVWIISWAANKMKRGNIDQIRALLRAMTAHEQQAFRRKSHSYLTRAA